MPIQPAQPFNSFLAGRNARDQEDATRNRNALADIQLQNAPIEAQQRQQMNSLAIQGTQDQFDRQKLEEPLKQTAAAAMRVAQSQSPRDELQAYPDFAAGLFKQHPELAQFDDNRLRQYMTFVAGQAQSKLGIAPPQPKTPEAFTLKQGETRFGPNGQPVANVAKPASEMTPYQTQSLAIQRQRLSQGGTGGQQVSTMTPDEVKTAGLPEGTVAQRNQHGKINVIKKPDAAGGGVKLTEGDKRARVTFASVLNAENDIAKISGVDTASGTQIALGSNPLTRGMQSDEFRKYEAAGLRWAANLLYLKSGATATPEEVKSTWKQFFPQFGDGDGAKAEKSAARLQELNSIADAFGLDKSKIPKGPEAAPAKSAQPVQVTSPAEAMNLAPGTVFITPDGRRKVR